MSKFSVILQDAINSSDEGREQLKSRLQESFQLSKNAIEDIFANLPTVLKQELSFQEAQIFSKTLESVGAKIKIEIISDKTEVAIQFESETSVTNEAQLQVTPELEVSEELSISSTSSSSHITEVNNSHEPLGAQESNVDDLSNSQINQAFAAGDIPEKIEITSISFETAQSRPNRKLVYFFAGLVVIAILLVSYITLSAVKPSQNDSPKVAAVTSSNNEDMISQLLEKQRLIKEKEASVLDQSPKISASIVEITWAGEDQISDIKSNASLVLQNETLKSLVINLTGTEPPKRTPEQIVAKVPAKIWLSKAEIIFNASGSEGVSLNLKDGDLSFEISGKGRAFLRQDNAAMRSIPEFIVKGIKRADSDFFEISWILGPENQGSLEAQTIEKLQDNSFRMNLSGQASLTPQ